MQVAFTWTDEQVTHVWAYDIVLHSLNHRRITVQPQASWWNEKLRGGELRERPVSIIVFFQGLLCNLPIYGPTSLPFPSWNSQSTQSFHCDIYLQFPVWVLRECVLMVHVGNIRRTVLCNNYPHQKGTFTMWAEHSSYNKNVHKLYPDFLLCKALRIPNSKIWQKLELTVKKYVFCTNALLNLFPLLSFCSSSTILYESAPSNPH